MGEPVYRTVILVAQTLAAIRRWNVITHGADNVPAEGPAILAINHAGYLDFVFAAWSVTLEGGRLVRYMAKKQVFDHKISGPLMRGMKHIPVDREGDAAAALEAAARSLSAGEVVGTFPEATINRSFVPGKGKTGTVRLAQRTGAPVVPVAVWGAHRIMTKGRPRNFQRGVEIRVMIGESMRFEPDDDPREGTDLLMDEIRTLLAKAQADYSQSPSSESDRWWLPAHLGGSAPRPEEVRRREGEAGLE